MAVNRERKVIWKEVGTFSKPDYETLADILIHVKDCIGRYGEDARVTEEYTPYDNNQYFAISIQEKESDKQWQSRIDLEEQREESEKKEYLRLKKKFES